MRIYMASVLASEASCRSERSVTLLQRHHLPPSSQDCPSIWKRCPRRLHTTLSLCRLRPHPDLLGFVSPFSPPSLASPPVPSRHSPWCTPCRSPRLHGLALNRSTATLSTTEKKKCPNIEHAPSPWAPPHAEPRFEHSAPSVRMRARNPSRKW